jgi:drug/metabolite transporter (DMT)-like permease
MKPKLALDVLLGLLLGLLLFHISIIAKIIPYDIVWGGRLKSDSQMFTMEIVSILVTAILIFVLLIRRRYMNQVLPPKIVQISLWVFFVYFIINSIGNLLAESLLEKVFTLLTIVFSYLLWIIIRNKPRTKNI